MGKKSKRRLKKSGNTSFTQGTRLAPATIVSFTSGSSFLPPYFATPVPENGWARELRYAEKELRHNPRSIDVILRAAKAACVMRQFDRLMEIMEDAESKGVTIEGDDLALWQTLTADWEANNSLSYIQSPKIQDLFSYAFNNDAQVDVINNFRHNLYSNLNPLQVAASMGDIQLLERLVSLGAALDYASDALDDSMCRTPETVKKPIGGTALLLAVISACFSRKRLSNDDEADQLRELYEGQVECAIQLVRLGASVNTRLQLPAGSDAKADVYEMIQEEQWVGKSVRDLAQEMGSEFLVQTIELFDAGEGTISLVNCRCGSRLPWKKCHAGKGGDCFHNKSDDSEKILWRYSPLAKCPCGNSNKSYFKCCWEETTFREHYKDDETAGFKVDVRGTMVVDGRVYTMEKYRDLMKNVVVDDAQKQICDFFRKGGQQSFQEISHTLHPKSKLGSWDPLVYAGVIEQMHIDEFFEWKDVHWNIPKRELLKRVDEWNDALKKFCDKEGLTGSEREQVIKQHTASPFAPCSNLYCEKVETKVKEFEKCSRCNFVGYCSHACLIEDLPYHKQRCTKIGSK